MHHGGDTGAARRTYGDPPGGWLDLSTGINPTAYPYAPPAPDSWTRLPQADAEADLIAAARTAYDVRDAARIVAAPGTQILIQLVARLRPQARVAIAGPTYAEHAVAWRTEGAMVETSVDVCGADADVAVVVNPNNPDGRIMRQADLLLLAQKLSARGGLLVVDEAFADVDPGMSVVPHVGGSDGLIVLRSFGKFYGLAGVRLGFAIGNQADVGKLAAWLGPWATSGPAIDVGRQALRDHVWAVAQRHIIRRQSKLLAELLVSSGLAIVGNAGLYVLGSHPGAASLHRALARRGVWVRRFEEHPTWLRFGLPGTAIGRFADAIRDAVREVTG